LNYVVKRIISTSNTFFAIIKTEYHQTECYAHLKTDRYHVFTHSNYEFKKLVFHLVSFYAPHNNEFYAVYFSF